MYNSFYCELLRQEKVNCFFSRRSIPSSGWLRRNENDCECTITRRPVEVVTRIRPGLAQLDGR